MENVFLIVGLGNPGGEYADTRHNAGVRAAETLAERWRVGWSLEKKFQARVARADLGERRVVLCEPQTYMNLSGEAVRAVLGFYRVPVARLLVLVDDADLPFGEIRLRARGSSGGHHGLDSVAEHVGTTDYARLKIGIGQRRDGPRQITGFVLSPFAGEEKKTLGKILARVADQAECWMAEGVERAMNKFNGVAVPPGS